MVVQKKNGAHILICDKCGKISSFKEMKQGGGGSWKFVPHSDVSSEEDEFRCKICTEKHGKPIPRQNVRHDMCCGIY